MQRIHEPKGSLTIPPLRVTPNARKRAQHVKGVTKDDVKTQGKNAEIFVSGKEGRSGSPETYFSTSRSGREGLTQHGAKRSSFSKRRDFFDRQGRAKRQPGDVLLYVEERTRSSDAAYRKKIKFFMESLILAQDERWRRA